MAENTLYARLRELSLRELLRRKGVRQASQLYAALAASLALGIVVSVINTRLLGPQAFGDFKFLQTVWNVSVVLVTFGLFTTGGNLLAEREGEAQKRLLGSLLVLATGLSVVLAILLFLVATPFEDHFGRTVSEALREYSWATLVFPFQVCLRDALRGTNDIADLALLNVLPQVFYIPLALGAAAVYGFTLNTAVISYLLGIFLTVATIVIRVRPVISNTAAGIATILNANRTLGTEIYVAILVTTLTTQLGQFSLAYFFGTKEVGEFALALTLTMPLTLMPNAVSTTFFRRFAASSKIPPNVLMTTVILSMTSLVVFLAVAKWLVHTLYTGTFASVVPVAYVCAVGAILHGMGDVLNRFLLAKGEARLLRKNSLHLGILSIFGYLAVVALWGVHGAALTKLFVDSAYLVTMVFYYQRCRAAI